VTACNNQEWLNSAYSVGYPQPQKSMLAKVAVLGAGWQLVDTTLISLNKGVQIAKLANVKWEKLRVHYTEKKEIPRELLTVPCSNRKLGAEKVAIQKYPFFPFHPVA
jgi:hypothetical protein